MTREPLRPRPAGQSRALGANDPRGRRANAGTTAAGLELERDLNDLSELADGASQDEIRARLNEVVRLLKRGL